MPRTFVQLGDATGLHAHSYGVASSIGSRQAAANPSRVIPIVPMKTAFTTAYPQPIVCEPLPCLPISAIRGLRLAREA